MMFGAQGNIDHDQCIHIIRQAIESGINFIDTADIYNAGESERIVAKALAGGLREHVILASKVHDAMGEDPNMRGNSRRWIMTEVGRTVCGAWEPTIWTSTRFTLPIRTRTSMKRSPR